MSKFINGLMDYLCDEWFNLKHGIKSCPGKTKRLAWNRGIKLRWNRLWIRKNEFHSSLDLDTDAIREMNDDQRDLYLNDLAKRRQVAHQRDIDREDQN